MLKIRLTRRGKRNKAFFRLVVAEHTSPIKGKFIEALGFLNPHTKEKGLKSERIKYWLEKGAQCSDSAHNMLVKEGILKGPKRVVKMKPSSAKASEGEKKEEVKEPASSADKEIKSEEKIVPEKEEKTKDSKNEAPKEEKAAEHQEEKKPENKIDETVSKEAEKETVVGEKK